MFPPRTPCSASRRGRPQLASRAGEARPPAADRSRPTRDELDSIGVSSVSREQELWGGETTKAIANFPVSEEPIPASVARWLGRIKGAAARVNAELGLLDADK